MVNYLNIVFIQGKGFLQEKRKNITSRVRQAKTVRFSSRTNNKIGKCLEG